MTLSEFILAVVWGWGHGEQKAGLLKGPASCLDRNLESGNCRFCFTIGRVRLTECGSVTVRGGTGED